MTMDSGTEVTLVPKKIVPPHCFMGEEQPVKGVDEYGNHMIGAKVRVTIQVLDETQAVEALALPGTWISWMGALCKVPTV